MPPFLHSFALLVLMAVPLGACGDLPRPFEGAGREGDPSLLELRDTGTVRVEGGDDLPQGASAHLARAMARALRKRDIAAYSDSQNGGDYILRPNVQTSLVETGAKLDVTWVLMRPDGLAIDTTRSVGELSSNQWFADEPTGPEESDLAVPPDLVDKVRELDGVKADPLALTYDGLVALPADQIAFMITGDRSAFKAAPFMKIALIDFAGAPGDGNTALARSAGALLQSKGIIVDKEIGEHSIILSASVDVRPVEEATREPLDKVSIDWVIMEVDGTELGQMQQNNVVPRGSLDKHWGAIASIAAQAAVETLEGVLGQIATRKQLQLRADKKTASAR
ncbi:MAG: hypothetical protein RIB30_01800 [Thalassospira sp.]|uniref:hypothetical protein n=1 Tax=Thalassospira sp. TaxID=1912094 RepID=UPI0032F024F9